MTDAETQDSVRESELAGNDELLYQPPRINVTPPDSDLSVVDVDASQLLIASPDNSSEGTVEEAEAETIDELELVGEEDEDW